MRDLGGVRSTPAERTLPRTGELESEADLIARAQAYDADALSTIYETYYPRLYNYCRLQLGDAHLAEDVTSDVLLQVLEALREYRFRGTPFAAWVFRIARNRLIDHHRRSNRRPQVELSDVLPSQSDGPPAITERAQEYESVRAAIGHLTEEQRQVIILKFVEDLDNSAIAQVLGRSLGAVKSLQHRALVSLRKVLEREGLGG
ncbi:MAG TPA: sigma-70 family RNA polymerase sigma factor [Dehalococcoidia bacterium]|nr:sigma-70 family RNA polymerase sigma factor [Dehalococcoidia bacterium]